MVVGVTPPYILDLLQDEVQIRLPTAQAVAQNGSCE